jgi:hypothetical protein
MITQEFTLTDLVLSQDQEYNRDVKTRIYPTITLGAFCAHRLKFNDGGLRSLFSKLSSDTRRLIWLQAIQSTHSSETLSLLLARYPLERKLFFGPIVISSPQFEEEMMTQIFRRKNDLAQRIDMCASQALGYAVTFVRTICMLASQGETQYTDILARSLKVGFLVSCQSFLSTYGDELGMIEDMEIALLWLSLITLRLVVTGSNVSSAHRERMEPELTQPVRETVTGDVSGEKTPRRSQLTKNSSSRLQNNNRRRDLADSDGVIIRRDSVRTHYFLYYFILRYSPYCNVKEYG